MSKFIWQPDTCQCVFTSDENGKLIIAECFFCKLHTASPDPLGDATKHNQSFNLIDRATAAMTDDKVNELKEQERSAIDIAEPKDIPIWKPKSDGVPQKPLP